MQPTHNPSEDSEHPIRNLLDVLNERHLLLSDMIEIGPGAPYATIGVKFSIIGGFRAEPSFQSSRRNQLGLFKSQVRIADVLAPFRYIWFEDFVFFHAGIVAPEGQDPAHKWYQIPQVTVSSLTVWRAGERPIEIPTIAMSMVKGIWVC